MTATQTLTFGDDGTSGSDVAWLFVNSHSWPGWHLEVLEAHIPDISERPSPEEAEPHGWTPPEPRVVFAEAGFADVTYLTAAADPRIALSRDTGLIVVGARGPGLLKSLHLGSTAEWLLVHPPAPMVIARHGGTVRDVVVCVDGSGHAERVTEVVATLPFVADLNITVLAIDDGRTDVNSATRVAEERLTAAGAQVKVEVATGKPTKEIERHIEKSQPDLLALGTMGLTGLRRMRLGSTAGSVARAATCSVLVACDEAAYLQATQSD